MSFEDYEKKQDRPRIEKLEKELSTIKQAIRQLYEIDRRFATPPSESIEGALEEILNEQS